MGKYYIWKCVKCHREEKWDGTGLKPDTTCGCDSLKAKFFSKGKADNKRVQMPLREMPK